MKGIDIFISFFALFGIFSIFFESLIWPLLISFILIALKEITKNIWLKNAIVFLVVGFFGAYIGYSLGILPIFLLLVLIAIYDYIAVFKTKHMVFLANQIIDKNTLFVMDYGNASTSASLDSKESKLSQDVGNSLQNKAIPTQRNHLHLGTGDFALPLMAIMSLFAVNFIFGIIAFLACLFCLELTIWLLFTKKHLALPAIPLQAIGFTLVLAAYFIYILI
jgi:presenilin-like A22 family membrane protease